MTLKSFASALINLIYIKGIRILQRYKSDIKYKSKVIKKINK